MTDEAIVKNAADPEQVREGKKKERLREEQRQSDLRAVLGTDAGQRVLWWIINDLCHVDTSSFMPSGSVMYYQEGERNIGRLLKAAVCEAELGVYQRLEREYWAQVKEQRSR